MKCETCRFFFRGEKDQTACRINPPVVAVLTDYRQPVRAGNDSILSQPQAAGPPVAVQSIPVSIWPHVTADHWCGQWQQILQ